MPDAMPDADTIVRRACRRLAVEAMLRGSGSGCALGTAAGLVLLAADRLLSLGLSWPVLAAPVLAGLGAGALQGLARAPSALAAAVRLDRRLELHDRLGTAESVRRGMIPPDEFADLARSDADRAARGIDLRGALPLRPGRRWALAVAAAAVLALGFIFLPAIPAGEAATPEPETPEAALQRLQLAAELDQTIRQVDGDLLDERSREGLDALRRLEEQLREPATRSRAEEARDESAALMAQLAERLAEESQQNLESAERAARLFGEAVGDGATDRSEGIRRRVDGSGGGDLEEFRDALRRGDLEGAAEAFEELTKAARSLPPQDRVTLAEQLRQMARRLEGATPAPQLEEHREQITRAMRDLGLDEESVGSSADEPRAATDTRAEEARPSDAPGQVDQETLRRLAAELERLKRQERIQDGVTERLQSSARALREAADDIETAEPPRSLKAPDDTPPQPDESSRPPQAPDDMPPDADRTRPGEEPRTGKAPPPAPAAPLDTPRPAAAPQAPQTSKEGPMIPPPESSDVSRPRPSQPPQGTGTAPAAGTETREPPPAEPADRGEAPGPITPGSVQPAPPGPQSAPPLGDSPRPPSDGQTGETGRGEEMGDRPGAHAQDAATGTRPPGAGETPADVPTVGEILKWLQENRRHAQEQRQMSRQLMERAREFADSLTPGQKEELRRRWLGDPAGRSTEAGVLPGSAATDPDARPGEPPFPVVEDLDLRQPTPGDTFISEWIDGPGAADPTARALRSSALQAARSSAERAVERGAVPSRYHRLIRRYFGRLPEAASSAGGPARDPDSGKQSAPPAPRGGGDP